jgi:DnaB-like helicase N terminal domain
MKARPEKSRKVVPWTADRNRPNERHSKQDSPPHSVEAEQGVLGSMLTPHGGNEAIAKIGADYFFVPAHRTIFTAICDLYDAGQAVDLITFTQHLRDWKDLRVPGSNDDFLSCLLSIENDRHWCSTIVHFCQNDILIASGLNQ